MESKYGSGEKVREKRRQGTEQQRGTSQNRE